MAPHLPPTTRRAIAAVLKTAKPSFRAHLEAAGLDPLKDLRHANFRGVRFRGETLTDFDFTGADLRNTDIALSPTTYIIGPNTRTPDGVTIPPPPGFDEDEARAMILAGTAPPRPWLPFIREMILDGEAEFRRLAPLAGCFNLRKLGLGNTQVSDLAHIAGLANLRYLDLGSTQVSDLAHIAGLANLQDLVLQNTQVSDLAPIAGLANLQYLHLRNTQVSDLAHIAGLANLRHLSLSNTQVSDLAHIAGLANLKNLYLSNTQVSDLAHIAHLIDNGLNVYGKDNMLKALKFAKKRSRKR